ncbi:MAG: hypothetical protein WA771_12490 [Chthoniobacterales bacterium]
MTAALTAGALTVSLPGHGKGVVMRGTDAGTVSFIIGGSQELVERADFVIDWGRGILAFPSLDGETACLKDEVQP